MKYKVVLEILGKKWTKEGTSIVSALNKFKFKFAEIKGKGTITVICGRGKYEHLYNMAKLRQIFNVGGVGELTRQIVAKDLTMLLKSDKKTNIPK